MSDSRSIRHWLLALLLGAACSNGTPYVDTDAGAAGTKGSTGGRPGVGGRGASDGSGGSGPVGGTSGGMGQTGGANVVGSGGSGGGSGVGGSPGGGGEGGGTVAGTGGVLGAGSGGVGGRTGSGGVGGRTGVGGNGLGGRGVGTGGVGTGGVGTGGMNVDAAVDAPACPNGKMCGSRCVPANGCCDNSGCTAPQTCGGGGTPDVCGCTRTTTCTGKCGNVTDNCGATLACGMTACLPGQTCNASNACTCSGRQCTSICCPTPAAGTTSMCLASGTQCGVMCNPGTHSCSSTLPPCYSDTDTANCGVEGGPCVDCRQPNANNSCGTAANCANTCLLTQVHLAGCAEPLGKPNCSQWEFESGTVENWVVGTNSTAAVGQPASSTAQHYLGSGSLSQRIQTPSGQDFGSVYLKVLLCAGKEAISVVGKSITGQIRFEPPPPGNATMSAIFYRDSALTSARIPEQNPRVDSTTGWIGFNIAFPDSSGTFAGIGIGIDINTGGYNGTVYLDDVMLQ